MKTISHFVMLLVVITVAPPSWAQRQFPMLLVNESDLLFETIQASLSKNRVSQMYFVTIPDPVSPGNMNLDTSFYKIRRNGQRDYLTYTEKTTVDDNQPAIAIDTLHFGADCSEHLKCHCLKNDNRFDSIACNAQGKIIFTRQLSINRYFIYDGTGRLKEQRLMNNSPDGSSWYKGFYKYNGSGRLIAVVYGAPGKLLYADKTYHDTFSDFSFPVLFKTTFEYNAAGQLTQISFFSKNEKTGKFLLQFKQTYIYKNGLLSRVNYYENDPNEIMSFEKVGYRFY